MEAGVALNEISEQATRNREVYEYYTAGVKRALAAAYVAKTGSPESEILELMDRETWLTANQALKLGFVDSITSDSLVYTNNLSGVRLTDEIRAKVMSEKQAAEKLAADKENLLSDLDLYGI